MASGRSAGCPGGCRRCGWRRHFSTFLACRGWGRRSTCGWRATASSWRRATKAPANCGRRIVRSLNPPRREAMSDKGEKRRSEADAELEREIRKGRKFTLAEAIGRLAGPGAMKGASPVARQHQAAVEIETWLRHHFSDPAGALGVVLLRHVRECDLLLNNPDQPLIVLAAWCHRALDSEIRLQELVREADIEWGRVFGERPHFEKGSAPDADDPYTLASVRADLSALLEKLAAGMA